METDEVNWRKLLAIRMGEILRAFRLNPWKHVDIFEKVPSGWDAAFVVHNGVVGQAHGGGILSPSELGHHVAFSRRDLRVVVAICGNATSAGVVEIFARFERWLSEQSPGLRRVRKRMAKPLEPHWLTEALSVPSEGPISPEPKLLKGEGREDWHNYKYSFDEMGFPGTKLLIVAPYCTDGIFKIAARMGFWIWDASGNYRCEAPGLCVERLGCSNRYPVREAGDRAIFSKRSAQVARALFDGGDRSWTRDELSDAAGVSAGQTSTVVHALVKAGFCEWSERGIRVVDSSRLWRRLSNSWESAHSCVRFSSREDTLGAVARVLRICRKSKMEYLLSLPQGGNEGQQHGLVCVHVAGSIRKLAKASGLFPDRDGRIMMVKLTERSALWRAVEKNLPGIGRALVVDGLQRRLDLALAGETDADSELEHSNAVEEAPTPEEIADSIARLRRLVQRDKDIRAQLQGHDK